MTPVNEHVTALPAAPLRPFIDSYSGYREDGVAPAGHLGLPSPYLTVIFTLDDPLTIAAHPDPRQPAGTYDTLAGGLHTTPALITHDGHQSGIQLRLSPLGARAILGVPAGELAGLDVDAAAVLGPLATQIHYRVAEQQTWARRFAVLDELLTGQVAAGASAGRPAGVSEPVGWAWAELLRTGGAVPVARLAAQAGWSDRHLRSRFRAEIGLTPKAAARVVRFDRARHLLLRRVRAGRPPALARLAACAGYYDQAHLDREFAGLAGRPPTAWLAHEFRYVQAVPEALLRG